MPYRFEVSPNKRAGCKAKLCKDQGIKIEKGEFRLGTFFQIDGHDSTSYKHWGCVTPAQLENILKETEGNTDLLDGYDDLPQDLQEKLVRALEQGHVDDEDWRDDIAMNRPGAKRPRAKKAKAEPDDAEEEGSVKDSPAPKRKRKTAKPEATNGAAGEEKASGSGKRKRKSARDAEPEVSADEGADVEAAPPVKKGRGKAKGKPVDADDEPANAGEEGAKPSSKKRKTKTSKAKAEPAAEDDTKQEDEIDEAAKPKSKGKARGRKKA